MFPHPPAAAEKSVSQVEEKGKQAPKGGTLRSHGGNAPSESWLNLRAIMPMAMLI